MKKQVTGYKWNSEQGARSAQSSLKNHFLGGRPQGNPNGDGKAYTTTEWVSVEYNDGASGTFWYFLGDYSPILGAQPQTFDIDLNDEI